jgi:hypothetical protein
MAEGRIAWTVRGKDNSSVYYALIPGTEETPALWDGSIGDNEGSDWHNRVKRGVRAIDKLLTLAGVPSQADDVKHSLFDKDMSERVKQYQLMSGIFLSNPSGYVGQKTMRSLVQVHLENACREVNVAPRWIWGQIVRESGFDPGAQGQFDVMDSGICQLNCSADGGGYSLEDAYNPTKALRISAHRFASKRDLYLVETGGDRSVAVNAAILQHWSPAAADEYVNSYDQITGEATWPGPESREYVEIIRENSRTYDPLA